CLSVCFTQTQGCDEGCAHAAGTEHGCMPQLHAPSAHCAQSHRTHRRPQTHHCGVHMRDGERESDGEREEQDIQGDREKWKTMTEQQLSKGLFLSTSFVTLHSYGNLSPLLSVLYTL